MKNLTSQVFGRLTVVQRVYPNRNNKLTWRCKCRCGAIVTICGTYELTRPKGTKSCGCCQDQVKYPIEYSLWCSIRTRCYDINHKDYPYYGGRGIRVCDKWQKEFLDFLEDIGKRPELWLSLDRIDNKGNYEPGNVRWATRSQQQLNKSNSATSKHGELGRKLANSSYVKQ